MIQLWYALTHSPKYAVVVLIQGKSQNDLALGMIESIAKMGKTPQAVLSR